MIPVGLLGLGEEVTRRIELEFCCFMSVFSRKAC